MRYCIRIIFTDNEFISLFRISSGLYADIGSHSPPRSPVNHEGHLTPSIPSDHLPAHSRARRCDTDHIIGDRSVNTYATDRTHPHVKNTFNLAIGIRRLHAHSASLDYRLILSCRRSFTLSHCHVIQEKHHFIIQIRLVLNCLKPRTEFKLVTARSSPHDRWLLVLSEDTVRLASPPGSSCSVLYRRPFMVETRPAFVFASYSSLCESRTYITRRCSFFFFLSTTLKYRRSRANVHVTRHYHQRYRFFRFAISSHLSYAKKGCYVNVKLCID